MNISKKISEVFILFCITLVLIVFISLFNSIFIYYLWNWLITDIFSLPTLTLFQAWGISVLSNILFKDNYSKS